MEPYWKDGLMDPVKFTVQRTPHQLTAFIACWILRQVAKIGEDLLIPHQLTAFIACWILRQVAKIGEDLLIPEATESHPRDTNTVLTVFETFTSNNMRKRTLRSLAEVCHVAAMRLPHQITCGSEQSAASPKSTK